MYWAYLRGHEDIVNYLIQKGAFDPRNLALLVDAVKKQEVDRVELLLRSGVPLNIKDEKGYAPLMYAVYFGNLDIVKLLLQYGANVNTQDLYGYTPLMMAVWRNQLPMVELLLRRGARQDLEHESGRVALHFAAERGDVEMLSLLFRYGGRRFINHQDKLGWTPLMLAVKARKKENVKFFVDRGANIYIKNISQKTAIDIAKELGYEEILSILSSPPSFS